ncbi:Novel Trtraspanin family protein loc733535 [Xenopus tropicalis]|uniref:Tetraspanin n=1 Tax=Xenopus tropicalis TaxID=8364 RepID=Q28HU4_XENTR|nr:uncharacterized protein LOC733515 [Xenopus tropicalis]AAI60474.1 Novel Trtraspanin family protein [Xenopus tropicalis]CAJ83410.1 Novel Trtraspanin family protein [Xenopus tropicalis]|eukprot:NP_001037906.1 Novel Trtraspanin family protein [Xenopus tropicalis]
MEKVNVKEKLLCLKAGLLFIILLFWVTGVALICLGATVQLRLTDISVVLSETSSGAPLVLTVTGIIIFIMSGFGAISVLKENNMLIKTFIGIMVVIFIIEIIVGISAYSYREKLQSDISRRFQQILSKYGIDGQLTRSLDYAQQEFRCCGAQNFTDWMNVTVTLLPSSVPKSCCRKVTPKCGEKVMAHQDNIFLEGCVIKMKTWISQHIDVIGAVGVGLGFVQLFGILLSFLLVKILQENYVSL